MKIITGLLFLIPLFLFALGVSDGDNALQQLKDGNERFKSGKSIHPNMDETRRLETVKNGQHPIAAVLTCSDSRVPVEIIFDQGIGDIFTVKVAGNVCDIDEIGSLEYAVEHLSIPLILVLGHSHCGAVTAIAKGEKVGDNISNLVDNIHYALDSAKKLFPNLNGEELVPESTNLNVYQSIKELFQFSPIAREAVKHGKLKVVGAVYDIETGQIQLLGNHPLEKELIELTSLPKVIPGNLTTSADNEKSINTFLSSSNLIYMGGFILICTLISWLVIFLSVRSKSKQKELELGE